MNLLESWVRKWDSRIAAWIDAGPGADIGCGDIRRCYQGSGKTEVHEGAMLEPYVGDPLSGNLAGVALHLNPGGGMPEQTWPHGTLVAAVRKQGYHEVYRSWAIPQATADWWADSCRWLQRLAGPGPACGEGAIVGIDVFPWHSTKFGRLNLDAACVRWLDANVLLPAAAAARGSTFGALTQARLGAPAVLAVGGVFATLLEKLGFDLLDEASRETGPARFERWPEKEPGVPTTRTVRIFRSRERGLVVLQTSAPGSNSLPRSAFDPILREMLRAAA